MNHPANAGIIPSLVEQTKKKANQSMFALLKLLSPRLFQPSMYKGLTRIGNGMLP